MISKHSFVVRAVGLSQGSNTNLSTSLSSSRDAQKTSNPYCNESRTARCSKQSKIYLCHELQPIRCSRTKHTNSLDMSFDARKQTYISQPRASNSTMLENHTLSLCHELPNFMTLENYTLFLQRAPDPRMLKYYSKFLHKLHSP